MLALSSSRPAVAYVINWWPSSGFPTSSLDTWGAQLDRPAGIDPHASGIVTNVDRAAHALAVR